MKKKNISKPELNPQGNLGGTPNWRIWGCPLNFFLTWWCCWLLWTIIILTTMEFVQQHSRRDVWRFQCSGLERLQVDPLGGEPSGRSHRKWSDRAGRDRSPCVPQGRNADEQLKMMGEVARYNAASPPQHRIVVSVEIEKPREKLYQLFPHADVVSHKTTKHICNTCTVMFVGDIYSTRFKKKKNPGNKS